MPIRETGLHRHDVASEAELRGKLEAELQNPKEKGEPEIIIASPTPGTTHLYVIWSQWDDLDQVVRSRIILDAFTAVRGEQEALQVTVSMGLTQAEADRLGIK